ncbi:unnamed protein product [Acanthoscelides obtectus]|uniref:Uncharacterized protein n=1 Tax=Acanthoscelides obtectus TaxID=200917 RepID=A0A9P0PMQ7_ACAOB|nr:unnamed protein product [Acanthoscelides obtectus]CAK1631987.1 hypothetical protein AOBTE_LOCUS7281 [Acanthoscelides obtectus]
MVGGQTNRWEGRWLQLVSVTEIPTELSESILPKFAGAYEAGLLKNCAFKPILYYSSNLNSAKGFRLAVVVFIILLQPSEAFDIYRTPTAGSNSKFDLIKFKYLHCIVTLILNYNNTNQIQQAGCVISVSEESIVISCFQHVFLVEMLKCVKKPLPELAIIVRLLGVRDWNILLDWIRTVM